MIYSILFVIALFGVSLATYLICKPQYREEDNERKYDEDFQMVSTSQTFIKINLVISIVFSIFVLSLSNEITGIITVGLVALIAEIILFIVGLTRKACYYTIDNNQISYIHKGLLQWSHPWTEIACAKKRIVSNGKTTNVLYDLTTIDGVVHKSLPNNLGKYLKQHVEIEWHKPNIYAIFIVFAIIISVFLLMIFLR